MCPFGGRPRTAVHTEEFCIPMLTLRSLPLKSHLKSFFVHLFVLQIVFVRRYAARRGVQGHRKVMSDACRLRLKQRLAYVVSSRRGLFEIVVR